MLAWLGQPKSMIPDAPKAVQHGVDQLGDWLNQKHEIAGIHFTAGKLLIALLLLLLFIVGSWVIRFVLRRYGSRHQNVNQSSIYTIERVVHYLLMVIGILVALTAAGVPMAKMTVFAGALGVGLGFGLQAIFNNFVSGLILLFERTLKVGDFVELASGVHGHVRDIHIRATRITTNDDIDILVPNSEFVNGRVVNWTLREVSRRIKVGFGVAYGTDKELVKKAALEAAADVPFTLTNEGPRAPQVWLTGFGDSSLDFKLVVWLNAEATRRPGAVTAAYYWALHTALEKYEIEIPFPQRDLHVRTWRRPPEDEDAERAREDRDANEPGHRHGNDAVRDVERDIAEASPAPSSADDPHAARGGNAKK
ncbi:mechanosensitive ion channel family protein [Oleiagrimonas soli]|uniref:Mechanosensitive ion channel protein MscS n=1 Tax=Oleiagrimonas soli TaxID=1543381 RepID=A0A099CSL8_9GAMM|nr:mechanosensitive ion channel domain-containing protein [Oleiagrimonas soli]KGI76978.1 mechanosensitive ion channel protein MscS [Oleiagrimonas soli]MBB6185193.1 small-conductance mechanosensitive channel [Oleiagrimonas soli]